MNAHPMKSFWSIGHVAAICETTTADVEAVAREIGINDFCTSINGVGYFALPVAALIEEHIQQRRGQPQHPGVAKAMGEAARAFNSANQ